MRQSRPVRAQSRYAKPCEKAWIRSLNQEAVGADAYCRDAAVAADTAQRLISERRATASV